MAAGLTDHGILKVNASFMNTPMVDWHNILWTYPTLPWLGYLTYRVQMVTQCSLVLATQHLAPAARRRAQVDGPGDSAEQVEFLVEL